MNLIANMVNISPMSPAHQRLTLSDATGPANTQDSAAKIYSLINMKPYINKRLTLVMYSINFLLSFSLSLTGVSYFYICKR